MSVATTAKSGKRKRSMMNSSSESCTITDTWVISNVAPFLDFRTLLSLRAVNKSLQKHVSEQELLSRSVADLRHLDLQNNFHIGAIARAGWSEKNIHRDAFVQSALEVANNLGQDEDSRLIIYEEEKALNLLTAGRPVSMADFQRRDADGVEDNDDDDFSLFLRWRVTAPKFHKSIDGRTAWLAFEEHILLSIARKYDENNTSAFVRVLFGLLINARSIRHNTYQNDWGSSYMAGKCLFGALLIETTDDRKFEIEMDHCMDLEELH